VVVVMVAPVAVLVIGMLSKASTSWAWARCAEARRGRMRREALILG
jgi:hypothetical protein